ncbi:dolichyl-phosphate-mannose--protein O-mannosyl transferase [Synechococcus sp. PCC 7502]|uniref:phospholipid carrier-dependent glycosyltransferase n=1 Tax=Synechococcus sp. PCC 7502 TaxID=1173263 RepID=UPI00029FD2B0|nr:phospholipid carrier-dependent glycosyltransferase [Synechococcus sp. PCC 7502]AFY75277.1 dolichyl-phosphate-mannose--protein O-mannosyl transferase [Synechococcus sp. PCC 7502]
MNQSLSSASSKASIKVSKARWQLIIWGLLIFAIALYLRLWEFNRLPYPIFDEVHFPKFAEGYIAGNPPNDGHPPLGKYIIALGIIIFGHNEIGYRITEVCLGACIPVLVMGLLYRLTYNNRLAIIGGILTLADGLFLVESRFGLMNVFLVCFGLCSQIFLIAGLQRQDLNRTVMLSLGGIMLGATAGIKWNGLGFILMTYMLIFGLLVIQRIAPNTFANMAVLKKFLQLKWYEYLICLVLLPAFAYILQWVPHVMMVLKVFAPTAQGWEWLGAFAKYFVISNHNIYLWNISPSAVGTPDHPIHPYCSSAASWPLLMRPIAYYFNTGDTGKEIWRAVQALGNPILWWLSSLAIVAIAFISRGAGGIYIGIYILIGYAANYLPWFAVGRCLFIYHYMSSAAFSFMALAVVIDWLLSKSQIWWQALGAGAVSAVIICQIFFMPVWLGLPISIAGFYQRMWFQPNVVPGFNWI